MNALAISEIITKDNLIHQGIFFRPKKEGKRVLLWVHGLSGKFYGDTTLLNAFIEECQNYGWGFASFNNRGHDLVASMHKNDNSNPSGYIYVYGGAGYEVFEECVYDIHAAVDFLVSKGFSEVVLVGHSTGATKVCYSEGVKPHENVMGIVLAGALSDRLGPDVDKKTIGDTFERMKQLISCGKGDELVNGLSFFPMTPKRYLSLYEKGSTEDVFDFDNGKKALKIFSAITKPLFVIISEKDEYLDRSAGEVVSIFDTHTRSKQYKSYIFPASDHGFTGYEKKAVHIITYWISSI